MYFLPWTLWVKSCDDRVGTNTASAAFWGQDDSGKKLSDFSEDIFLDSTHVVDNFKLFR